MDNTFWMNLALAVSLFLLGWTTLQTIMQIKADTIREREAERRRDIAECKRVELEAKHRLWDENCREFGVKR